MGFEFNPFTKKLDIVGSSGGGGGGTVTSVSVVSSHGLAGTVANPTTTPAITLSTTATGVLSGNGTTISGSTVTQHGVLVGGATNAVSSTAVGSTGQVLQANSGADPTYSTATYPSTSGSMGNVLTSDGTNWISSSGGGGGLTTINVDGGGSVSGSTIDLFANSGSANNGASVSFTAVSATEIDLVLTSPNFNLFIGSPAGVSDAGLSGGSANIGIGTFTLSSLTANRSNNIAIGYGSGYAITDGSTNIAIGLQSLNNSFTPALTGNFNTAIGYFSGSAYTGAEAQNTLINSNGVVGESNALRISDVASVHPASTCFIGGINGNTIGSPNFVTIDPVTGQLGSASSGAGGVSGPGSSTDRAISTWSGTAGTALFDNPTTNIDSTGRQTNSAQPCFSAYLNSAVNNVTGDLTLYQLIFDTVNFDNGSDYNTGTGLFTAPVTGRYLFSYTLLAIAAASTISEIDSFLTINSATFIGHTIMPAVAGNVTTQGQVTWSQIIPLTAGDTVKVQVNGLTIGSAKSVGFLGTANGSFNTFCGYLVC